MMNDDNTPLKLGDYHLSARDVADILWLTSFLEVAPLAPTPVVPQPDTPSPPSTDTPGEDKSSSEDAKESKKSESETKTESQPPATSVDIPESVPPPAAKEGGKLYTKPEEYEETVEEELSGVLFKTPRAWALSAKERRDIVRSLRPLQRGVPSTQELALDEAETAECIATALMTRQGHPLPVVYPVPERWLDLVILVDGSSSMQVWAQTVDELVALLTNTGIFRDVQTWEMPVTEAGEVVNDEASTIMQLRPLVAEGQPAPFRPPKALIDQQGRRLFLVFSDCSSVVWDNGAAKSLLQPLARQNLVTLWQFLPESLWRTTGLTYANPLSLTSRQVLANNGQFVLVAHEPQEETFFPLPTISWEPSSLARWAGSLVGRGQQPILGYDLLGDVTNVDVLAELQALGIEPQAEPEPDWFEIFRERVPERLRPLAAYFAAAPLTIPVMRMVQAAMMLESSTHADFVRVFYSGIIRRITPQGAAVAEDLIQYDFIGGDAMRERLLGMLPRYSVEQVVHLVIDALSQYVSEHVNQWDSFDAILAMQGVQGVVQVDAKARHFAEVSSKVLRYLGGIYTTLADNLEQHIASQVSAVNQEARQATLRQRSSRLWQRIVEATADIVETFSDIDVATYVQRGEDADTRQLVARSQIKLDGDSATTVPVKEGKEGIEVDQAFLTVHERSVQSFIDLGGGFTQALLQVFETLSELRQPPANTSLPHPVTGAEPLAMDWRWVPAGAFMMGSERYDAGKPVHEVEVAGYWLARSPVTNRQYRLFMEAGGYETERWWTKAGWQWRVREEIKQPGHWEDEQFNGEAQPVIGVSWYEAYAFCRWAAEVTGEGIRLPTEAEWEKGARGTDGRRYPWGNERPTDKLCNFNDNVGRTTPVGQYSPQGDSPYGCADMAGNAREWCQSRYAEYPYAYDGRNDAEGTMHRAVRGGSWGSLANRVRSSDRLRLGPEDRDSRLGFRCASAPL